MPRRHGEAKNSWLTGTAAWNFVAVSQHLLGVRPELRRSDRGAVSAEGCARIYGRHAGAVASTYVIHVKNTGSGGPPKLVVDGKPVDGNLVPYAPKGKTVQVQCTV